MISFIVTGFGPFHGVPENPTMILAQSLIEYIQQQEVSLLFEGKDDSPATTTTGTANTTRSTNSSSSLSTVPLSQRIRTLVIETSYKAARTQMNAIYEEIIAEQNDDTMVVMILHLGVHNMSRHYQLECCAYNEMQFRIPDMNGDRPTHCPIINTTDDHNDDPQRTPQYQSSLQTKLYHSLTTISQQLNDNTNQSHGNHTTATSSSSSSSSTSQLRGSTSSIAAAAKSAYGTTSILSTDPGRYVCNYIYYYSLYKFQAGMTTNAASTTSLQQQQDDNTTMANNSTATMDRSVNVLPSVKCLFLHVPPLTVASLKQQLRFVTDLMRSLEKEIVLTPP